MSQYITFLRYSFRLRLNGKSKSQNCFCNKSQIFYYKQANGEWRSEMYSRHLKLSLKDVPFGSFYWRTIPCFIGEAERRTEYPQKLQHVTTTTSVEGIKPSRVSHINTFITHINFLLFARHFARAKKKQKKKPSVVSCVISIIITRVRAFVWRRYQRSFICV